MAQLIGDTLGSYRILERLGVGGMAEVYKAYQPSMDRYVAIKVILQRFAQDATFLQRFQREARAVSRLEHPFILPVHDYGEAEGRPYLVMRYLGQGTLKDRLSGQPMPLDEVNRIIGQVGGALDYAHRAGIIHRDVKPSNILMDNEGNTFLTDFGLAKIMEASVQLTGTGVGIGTPAYMSPEQGQGETVDSRTDIYSLGVMLYEMVTGRRPYQAETPLAVVLKHISAPLPPPRSIRPDLPEGVERVILRAMAKGADDRFQTAGEMVHSLDAAVRSAEGAEPLRRRPRLWLIPALLLLFVALLALWRPWVEPEPVVETKVAMTAVPSTPVPTVPPTPPPTSKPPPSPTPMKPTAVPTSEPTVEAAVALKWSYTAPNPISYLDSWGDGLATGDLNGDGTPDVVFGTKGGYVVAVDGGDGHELWSYRISTLTDKPVNADVVDVDDDGVLDVVATGMGAKAVICALDREGNEKWRVQGDYAEAVDLAYGDIDGDGDADVAASVGTYSWGGGQVILIDGATGSRVWARALGGGHAQGIAARDVDGDGDMEVAVENYDNKVFLLDGATGAILWSRPKQWYGRDVIIEDVDGDGSYEIVSGGGGVASYGSDGKQEWGPATKEGMNISASDVNGDGQTEVVFSDAFAGELHVVDPSTGETLWTRTRSGAHALGDVSGDRVDDIVVGTVRHWGIDPPYSVSAVDGSDNLLWSYSLDSIEDFGLVTVNLDDDPALEVLVANGRQLLALDPPSLSVPGTAASASVSTATRGPIPAPSPSPAPSGNGCPAYPPGFTFVIDTKVYSVPDLAEPSPRQWFTDPTFGTCLVRVTDRANDLSPDDTSEGMVNEYSRVQSFNADGSRLLAHGTEGTWYLYDAQTLLPLGQLAVEVEPRWDPDDPDLLYYSDETRLMSLNVQSGSTTEVHDFADDFPGQNLVAVWTRHEGRPSRDGRYWGLLGQDQEWETVAFVVYDRQTDQVTIRDVRGLPGVEEGIDHVTISPLGNYFLASFDHYCEHGYLGDDANPCGLMVYDQDLTNGRSLLRIIGHYDPALDAQGREVIIYQDIDTDHISMLDLATGAVTPLWEIDFSYTEIGLHFSGLAFDRPGWAVVSTHDDDVATHTWMDDQVLLVELKPGGRVVRLAHTHSLVDESQPGEYYYWAEPHASANTDLTRVLFTTNWGRFDTGAVEVFMIALPEDWPARLPRED